MPDWLYGATSIWAFVVVTLILGGAAAFVSGRTIADTWRPVWQLGPYMLLLGCAVRFIQFAVFGSQLLSVRSLLVDLVVLLALGLAGYMLTRRGQMARQYPWLAPGTSTSEPPGPGRPSP